MKEVLPKNRTVQIEVDGKPVYVLPLAKDRMVSVDGPKGRTFIEIKNQKVRITESHCPNKLCIEQGWIDNGGLVCLPNKVVITIGGHEGKNTVPDAITG
jgi:hypothetical protein